MTDEKPCGGCGAVMESWRDQTLVTDTGPRVVRRIFRCQGCGSIESRMLAG